MKRLYRSEKDVKLFGVCSGIAEYFNIDPTLTRIAAAILTVMTGFIWGILGYFICYLIIPVKSEIFIAEEVKE